MEFKLTDFVGGPRNVINLYDTATYIQCPYYSDHTIEKGRIQFHLEKCRKAFPKIAKVTCPFDETHYVSEPELAYHVLVCSKRGAFDEYKFNVGQNRPVAVNLPPVPVLPDCEENWDEMAAPGYDPGLSMNNKQIVRKIRGAQPAERRRFRMEQRKLHGQNPN